MSSSEILGSYPNLVSNSTTCLKLILDESYVILTVFLGKFTNALRTFGSNLCKCSNTQMQELQCIEGIAKETTCTPSSVNSTNLSIISGLSKYAYLLSEIFGEIPGDSCNS